MPFTVKNSQLSTEAINSLNTIMDKDINASAAFKLLRITKFISSIVESKIKAEQIIFEKWSKKDENGKVICGQDENGLDIPDTIILSDLDAFSKEMSDLLNIENEIPYEKINFEELEIKSLKVKDLAKIQFLFVDFED